MNRKPGSLESCVNQRMAWHDQNRTISRLFNHDVSLWNGTGKPGEEIANRLGWLTLPTESEKIIPDLNSLSDQLAQEGFTTAVLLGMGGSSLAPYVIAQTLSGFGLHSENALRLLVLDSTNPDEIQTVCKSIDLHNTVFIISTKSGTTSETLALSDFFWDLTVKSIMEHPGRHFIAITDPGSKVIDTARQKQYRAVFTANPDVGGRFSALSVFGLLPACLAGVNLVKFLHQAQKAERLCSPSSPAHDNPGLLLGSILAEAYSKGIDKVVIVADPQVASFGVWAEQLLAESSGKNNKGIIPVSLEPAVSLEAYSGDRLFIYLRSSGANDPLIKELMDADHPCFVLDVQTFYDLAAQFYIWEIATAVACSQLGVNAFDQPNVQESKTITKAKIDQIRQSGMLVQDHPVYSELDFDVYWKNNPARQFENIETIFDAFFAQIKPGDYLAVNAFIPDNPENRIILQNLRRSITNRKKVTTTLGFGPRYLHSTGQLHKGGCNNGLFLVITQDSPDVVDIPGNNLSFNQLILAQAAGDIEALLTRGRRVIHIHFREPHKLSVLDKIK